MTTVTFNSISSDRAVTRADRPSFWSRLVGAMVAHRQIKAEQEANRVLSFYRPPTAGTR